MAPWTTIVNRIGIMPDKEWKINLTRLQSTVTLVACVCGLISPWLFLPQKIAEAQKSTEAVEARLKALDASHTSTREALIRIEERLKALTDRTDTARIESHGASK
jgi:hypothetical protein